MENTEYIYQGKKIQTPSTILKLTWPKLNKKHKITAELLLQLYEKYYPEDIFYEVYEIYRNDDCMCF